MEDELPKAERWEGGLGQNTGESPLETPHSKTERWKTKSQKGAMAKGWGKGETEGSQAKKIGEEGKGGNKRGRRWGEGEGKTVGRRRGPGRGRKPGKGGDENERSANLDEEGRRGGSSLGKDGYFYVDQTGDIHVKTLSMHVSATSLKTVHEFTSLSHLAPCSSFFFLKKQKKKGYNSNTNLWIKQERYYNKPTRELSRASVVHRIATLAAVALGDGSLSAIESGFEDPNTDMATRISFKYACSRGVTGTPYFFVNGFPLPDGGSAVSYDKWRSVIDPLVKKALT